jgi:hypothetical protein
VRLCRLPMIMPMPTQGSRVRSACTVALEGQSTRALETEALPLCDSLFQSAATFPGWVKYVVGIVLGFLAVALLAVGVRKQ